MNTKPSKQQSSSDKPKTPWHLWVLGVLALFFFSIGAYDFIMANSHNADYFNQLGYGEKQVEYFTNYPILPWIFWAIGTWASVAGAILLLARSRFATHALAISAVSLVILSLITFLTMDRFNILGAKLSIQDIVVTSGIAALFFYARYLTKKKVLK